MQGKNLLPEGANSFLTYWTLFRKAWHAIKQTLQELANVIFLGRYDKKKSAVCFNFP